MLWCCWLGGRKGIRPVKKQSGGVLVWLSVWSKMQTCIWPSWCHCHSLSLASVKSRLVLPFWYRLTWVVPEKGPLNVCVYACILYHWVIVESRQVSPTQLAFGVPITVLLCEFHRKLWVSESQSLCGIVQLYLCDLMFKHFSITPISGRQICVNSIYNANYPVKKLPRNYNVSHVRHAKLTHNYCS